MCLRTQTTMERKTVFTLGNNWYEQLKKNDACYEEISKEDFATIQRQYFQLRSMIYRTEETELPNGNSQLSFYSVCYVRKKTETKYFAKTVTFLVPPDDFLGDQQEAQVQRWLVRDKASFL